MSFRFHPVLIIWFCLLLATGQAGMFTLLFVSLFIHELGHLGALKFFGVTPIHCVFYPFGGRIEWSSDKRWTTWQKVCVYAAGPIATSILIALLWIAPIPIPKIVLDIQWGILLLNLLPLYPLDGGGILYELVGKRYPAFQSVVFSVSILFLSYLIFYSFSSGWWMLTVIGIVLVIENYRWIKA